ncbi:universal stress protein [Amycolatopsis sp. NPDC059657]|uniref:universal stress protein n=1 Tax=Amycolatopsis sp. NPDC059657 TaxID=3346899 RepID=UPI0036726D96
MAAEPYPLPVLAGVDGSGAALHAARWAAGEAALRKTSLRLVHARHPVPSRYESAAREPGRLWLREAAEAARASAPGVSIWCDLQSGEPATKMIEESASACLTVVGAWGIGKTGGSFIGLVARAVAAGAAGPSVIVRGADFVSAPPYTGPVVVGVDDGPDGLAALDFAARAASSRGRPLVAVRVWDRAEEAERALLERCVSGLATGDVRPVLVRAQHTAKGVLAEADHACLVVVGSRRRRLRGRTILGCTSHGVLDNAQCPVAVVPVSRCAPGA